jgi:hypothetical protein
MGQNFARFKWIKTKLELDLQLSVAKHYVPNIKLISVSRERKSPEN